MLFKSLTIPHAGFAAQDIDGSFVAVVLMRIGPSVRRESYDLQMDSPRSYGLRRDTGRIHDVLLVQPSNVYFIARRRMVVGRCELCFFVRFLPLSSLAWIRFCGRCFPLI